MSLNEKTGKVNKISQIKRRSKKVSNWLETICNDRDSNKNTDGEPFTLNHRLPRTEYLSSTVCQLTNDESCAGEISVECNLSKDGEPSTLNHHLPHTEYLSSTVCQLTNDESCAGEISVECNPSKDGEPFTLNHHLPHTEYLSSTVCQLTNDEPCAGELSAASYQTVLNEKNGLFESCLGSYADVEIVYGSDDESIESEVFPLFSNLQQIAPESEDDDSFNESDCETVIYGSFDKTVYPNGK